MYTVNCNKMCNTEKIRSYDCEYCKVNDLFFFSLTQHINSNLKNTTDNSDDHDDDHPCELHHRQYANNTSSTRLTDTIPFIIIFYIKYILYKSELYILTHYCTVYMIFTVQCTAASRLIP